MNKHMGKRLLSILVVITMLVGMMPTSVFAYRCRHTGTKHWICSGNSLTHYQVCDECGARIKQEDHNLTDDSQWDFQYLDVDYDMSSDGGGTHRQICKKCGYTVYNDHYYTKNTVKINGANHPNVLVCTNPKCNHIKEYGDNGWLNNHLYHTSYVNGDYHKTSCVYCDYAPGKIVQTGFEKVPAGEVNSSNMDQYYVFTNGGAYTQYKYLPDWEKKKYTTFYTLRVGFAEHKASKEDYEKHNWYQVRNSSQHWMECYGCHATYDKAGHDYYTYTYEGYDYCSKTTVCETCGWVKSIKVSSQRNKEGTAWVNFKERLTSTSKILEYNGCADEQPKPGKGGEAEPCKHDTTYYINGEQYDSGSYLYIGDRHEYRCHCGETLRTENCSFETETFEQVRRNYLVNHVSTYETMGADYIDWLYMEDYFKSGHYQKCKVCGGQKLVAHNWSKKDGSNATANSCKRTCKDCGFIMRYKSRIDEKDPSPHSYLKYQDNYWVDDKFEVHDPEEGCCSYTFVGGESSKRHRAKCDMCGYEHTEACDTDGWAEIPGQPGKHLRFCSKCGGGKTIVDCDREYVAGDNLPAGFHAVKCPVCKDIYIPKTSCDFVVDEKNTDEFHHTYKCAYCGFEWHDNHIRRTIKTNYIPPTAQKDGSYDLVTYCETCNKEITRSTITVPKKDNPNALFCAEGRYIFETVNAARLGSGSSYLNGTIVMDGVAEYLANNSITLLRGASTEIPDSFYVDGKQIQKNSSSRIVLYAKALMKVTDYTQDSEDVDKDDDKYEYTSMTATVTFTYSAYYVTTVNGVEYRCDMPVTDGNGQAIYNLPLNLNGASITMTLPLLTGMSSNQTMFVQQTTDNGNTYKTYLGTYHSDWGVANVTFTTTDGFDGEFLFTPTEHWLEYIERQEPSERWDGNIEYWHDKATDKYYQDILCEHEITKAQTYINANTYTLTFAPGEGGTGNGPLPIGGLHKLDDVILPECTFTNPLYEFYGWYSNGWVYKAGSYYTVTGDATLTAKWHLSGDTLCHITFHANADDAKGTMNEQVCEIGDTVRLQANAFTRDDWNFYGWSSDGEWNIPPYSFDRGTVNVTDDLDLYALWQPVYYITFDANGGEGTMEPQDFPCTPMLPSGWYTQYQSLKANTFTRDGYKFKCWALSTDGSGTTYQDGGVPPMETTDPKNYTLYAIWEKTSFDISFDANADDVTGSTKSVRFEKGIYDLVPECGFEREGYVFDYWSVNPDGTGYKYKQGYKTTFYNDTTLYAIWKKTHTITFDANGADNSMDALIVEDGSYSYLPYNTIVRDGYKFDGWNTEADGSGTKYYDNAFKQWDEDVTLYAQWVRTRFNVTYKANGGDGEDYVQVLDFGTGYSTVCPKCSAQLTSRIDDSQLTVGFCNCCGFGVVNKDEGKTDRLKVRSYASLYPYSLSTKFDELAASYNSLMAFYPDMNNTVTSEDDSEQFAAYTEMFNKAKDVMDTSMYSITKGIDYSVTASAIVGINNEFVLTLGVNEYSYEDTLGAVARLFGYSDTDTFKQYVNSAADVYIANEAGATTTYRLKYEGAVYTTDGMFVLPYVFTSDITDDKLVAFVIVDADKNVSVWLNDLSKIYLLTLYGYVVPQDVEANLYVYGRCSLFEMARAIENRFTKDRYVFSKWNTEPDGTGNSYTSGTTSFSSLIKDDLTLYAQWAPDFYTVTFDANAADATGTMEPQVIDKNVPTAVNKNSFTREGYEFVGWNTYASTGSFASIEDEGEITKSADTKLYAVWKKKYTFTFDANGGYGTMEPQTILEKTSSQKLNSNVFIHDTLGFKGWSLTPDGDVKYRDNASMYLSSDPEGLTLYAVWGTKTDVSSNMTFEGETIVFDGKQHPLQNAEIASTYTTGTIRYIYYKGKYALNANMLPEGTYPVDAGVYTIRAIYEDSNNKGIKDVNLTINKAARSLTPTSSLILMYGKDKMIGLRVFDDDDSALENLLVTVTDGSVVAQREGESYKSDNNLMVSLAYKGAGYTTVDFDLPQTTNYYAAHCSVTVVSKNGYNVDTDSVTGGIITVNKPMAPQGDEVEVSVQTKLGYTLSKVTVTDDITNQPVEVVDGKFVMPESNVLVSAEFVQNEYSIAYADAEGVTYGKLSDKAHYGDEIALSASVTQGRVVTAYRCVYGNSTVVIKKNKNGDFVLKMPADNVTVTAVAGKEYNVQVAGGTNGGSIEVSSTKAAAGNVITIIPDELEGYSLGAVSYTGDGKTYPVMIDVDNSKKTYSFVMPDYDVTVSASFIPSATINGAVGNVDAKTDSEQGKTKAEFGINVDDSTAAILQASVDALNINLKDDGESRNVSADEKVSALEALAQAGLVLLEQNGDNVEVKNSEDNKEAKVRVVEKTFIDVNVKKYEQTDENVSMTLDITPMKQTVATISTLGTMLDESNSVALSQADVVDVNKLTTITVGIPDVMAYAAGGVGCIIYVQHTHEGVTYEYPAYISGNENEGFTATFDNPTGYSEFTFSVRSNTVASYECDGITYSYTSLNEAITAALEKNVTLITMYKMPTGEDVATVTKGVAITFKAADGLDKQIDFDALYSHWIITDIGISKASTPQQLKEHIFEYLETIEDLTGDVNADGVVDFDDYDLLKRYYNGYNVEIDVIHADVNGDDKINLKDVALLKQYINGWNVVLV